MAFKKLLHSLEWLILCFISTASDMNSAVHWLHFSLAKPCTILMWSARWDLRLNFFPQSSTSHSTCVTFWCTAFLWCRRLFGDSLLPHSSHSTKVWWVYWWLLNSLNKENSDSQPSFLHFSFGKPCSFLMWSPTFDAAVNLWVQPFSLQEKGFSPLWTILLWPSRALFERYLPHSSHFTLSSLFLLSSFTSLWATLLCLERAPLERFFPHSSHWTFSLLRGRCWRLTSGLLPKAQSPWVQEVLIPACSVFTNSGSSLMCLSPED